MADIARPAVFLDKDGTLIDDVPYNVDPDRIRLASGASEGLARISRAGYRLFVVSNQSGVALGYFPSSALVPVEARLRELVEGVGARLDGFAFCPHHPEAVSPEFALACDCRKPAPGMIVRLAREHGVDLGRSWMIGDILDDVEAGRRAGCRSILIDNGNETEWVLTQARNPDYRAADLAEAARLIIRAGAIETPTDAERLTGARP